MTFKIEELIIKNDSETEQVRSKEIFETLKNKAIRGKTLSEHEKNFFCKGVQLSKLNVGILEDYYCCKNYKFKYIYLCYFYDLAGGSIFYKRNRAEIYKVEQIEAEIDLKYLYTTAEDWKLIIQKTNHKDKVLQEISIETRKGLKELSNLPEVLNGFWRKGSNHYILMEREILLSLKFIYCIVIEVFETIELNDLILKVNSIKIEFNEYSLIHILNRHFSAITKAYDTKKSFHNEQFKPRIIISQIKEILTQIDNSQFLKNSTIDKIGFRQNGIDYLIWTKEKNRSIKGINEIYRRLETFYIVTDENEKIKLVSDYNLKTVNNFLSVYVPK